MDSYPPSPTFPEDEVKVGSGASLAHLNSFFPGGAMGRPIVRITSTHLWQLTFLIEAPGSVLFIVSYRAGIMTFLFKSLGSGFQQHGFKS